MDTLLNGHTIGTHGQVFERRDVPHVKYTDPVAGARPSEVHPQ